MRLEVIMTVSPDASLAAGNALVDCGKNAFFVRCQCGQIWNLVMERGAEGPGSIPCSCGVELIVWSGTIAFSASPVDSL